MTASAVSLKCQENNNMWLTQTTWEILHKMKNKTRNIYNNNKLQTFLIWRKKQQTSGVILYKKHKDKNKNIYINATTVTISSYEYFCSLVKILEKQSPQMF